MDLKKVSEKIREARKQEGLSQESLAAVSNISLRTIQRIEKADVTPRKSTLKILSDHLKINYQELISESEEQDVSAEVRILKFMNVAALLTAFIPPANVFLPFIIWKVGKKPVQLPHIAGMIISFQIIWLVVSLGLFMLTILLTRMITEEAGEAGFTSLLTYLICVLLNVAILIWHTVKLGNKASLETRISPNFF
ncbi:MAG: helix-turn-helix domain-containing protein [Bacteroidota bacterium]